MSASSGYLKRSIYEGWVPATPVIHRLFLDEHTSLPPSKGHKKAVDDFVAALGSSKDDIIALFNKAAKQAKEYSKWADTKYWVQDWEGFLSALDNIVENAPKFYKASVEEHRTIGEPIGVPIYLLFDLISNTSAAYTLLNLEVFNKALKVLLNEWGSYLDTKESTGTLNAGEYGWFSPAALKLLESGLDGWSFTDTYKPDPLPSAQNQDFPYYKSWDSFFVREFNKYFPGTTTPVRPIPKQPSPTPERPLYYYLYNPCESTVFRTATNVLVRDTFWLKSQKYSLYDMLGGDAYPKLSGYAEKLEGGSVLQSFLAPQDYHRWHSPINGTVKASHVIDGTYYAVLPDEGAPEYDPDLLPGDPHGAMIRSQPWLSVAATRAVFIIEPETNSPIEWIAFIAIGMVEVSSCEISKPFKGQENVAVKVGEELGMFHFGGSTYTLVVKPKPGYDVFFQDIYDSPVRPGQHRWIHSVVGQIWKNTKNS